MAKKVKDMDELSRVSETEHSEMSAELNERLFKRIPEGKEYYDEVTSFMDGLETGSHLVFEDGLSKFAIANLHDEELSKRIFDFIEELLSNEGEDYYGSNVAYVSFIEPLVYNTEHRDYYKYLGPKSKEAADDYLKDKYGV